MTYWKVSTPTLNVGAGTRVGAAVVSNSDLAIVTVSADPDQTNLVLESCSFFQLKNGEGHAVKALAGSLRSYLEQEAIEHLFLCKGPESGPHAIKPIRSKLEFMVYRNKDVPVTLVASHVLQRWVKERKLRPQVPPAGVSSKQAQLQHLAVATAACALSKQTPAQ
jgi:hypothetical protein